ncbi:MAG: serine/threonine protein kinase [Planctomycetaceae bacterium]|nr:serine/threonine protein kinase [Planctomycetaceae bacterium]MCB9949514.1 serine/threonine protein kinase [Planctomycetaceae bacterium]
MEQYDAEREAELCQLLEQYAPFIEQEDAEQLSVLLPVDVLRRFPELPGMLRCMASLDMLAGNADSFDFGGESDAAGRAASASTPSSSFRAPHRLGPYLLEEELGRGGMGVVFRVRHEVLDAQFAMKLIRSSDWASDQEVKRFYREARAASRLQHSNIVRVHDVGEERGLHYLVMEYISGGNLAERITASPLSFREAAEVIRKVALAVAFLNEQGIVHRDLKPANILLDGEGNPHVTDFGLVKVFDAGEGRTTTGIIVGTPAYMAPEQAWGNSDDVGPGCDIYSLGAILYELLTGRPPFGDTGPLDQLLRLRDAEPLALRSIRAAIPVELERICLHCLEKNPVDRYQSAAELAADLERHLNGEPSGLPAPSLTWKLRRWIRRQPALVSRLTGFLVMAILLSVVEVLSESARAPYIPIMSVLGIWTFGSVILQQALNRNIDPWVVRTSWVILDCLLFTSALMFAEGPVESLVVGYSLLIAASAWWYQPFLVWMMTGASVIAFFVLFGLRGDSSLPGHYPYIVAAELAVVGGIVASFVRQIRELLQRRSFPGDTH